MEMVDLYDENRLPLGRTAERYAPKGEGEYRVVVHICVFDSRGRLLIQQRSREKAVWPEAWDVSAAGGVDAGETSRQAAEREFREELGVALDLTGVRPSCTVNFDGGFDDFFRLAVVAKLLEKGYAEKIMFGHDKYNKLGGFYGGAYGYTRFPTFAIPALREMGYEKEAQLITVANPARFLSHS